MCWTTFLFLCVGRHFCSRAFCSRVLDNIYVPVHSVPCVGQHFCSRAFCPVCWTTFLFPCIMFPCVGQHFRSRALCSRVLDKMSVLVCWTTFLFPCWTNKMGPCHTVSVCWTNNVGPYIVILLPCVGQIQWVFVTLPLPTPPPFPRGVEFYSLFILIIALHLKRATNVFAPLSEESYS